MSLTTSSTNIPDSSGAPVSEGSVLATFFGFILVLFLLGFVKKIYYRFFLKKRYYIIPRTQIKGIANIAMVISMAIAIIFSITILSANGLGVVFRAYVGTRMSIESILIKIGGLLFGPFIGIFIGAFTDLLTVILTSGVFHYGFFISAIGSGMLAGLVRTIIVLSKNNKYSLAIFNTILIGSLGVSTYIFFSYLPDNFSINSFIKIDFISKDWMLKSLLVMFALVISIIWLLLPFSNKQYLRKKKTKYITVERYGRVEITKRGHNTTNRDWYTIFISTLMIATISQVLIDVFMLPIFDIQVSTINYSQFFAMRFILCFPFIVFNTLILFLVYWVISPIISYDYIHDMVESISVPHFGDYDQGLDKSLMSSGN